MLKKDWVRGLLIIGCGLIILAGLLVYKNMVNKTYTAINFEQFSQKIENEEDFILYIGSATCSECVLFSETMNVAIRDLNVVVYYIDIDNLETSQVTELFEIAQVSETTPQTVFFQGGVSTDTLEGNTQYYFLVKFLRANS